MTEGNDWKIFQGRGDPHDGLDRLPPAPPWRFAHAGAKVRAASPDLDVTAEQGRALPFTPSPPMILAVNTALYLRRPLLLTGKPGTGKSTLISKVAYELKLGPVLKWPISSRSTVRSGVYEYDAVGRLQAGKGIDPPVEDYLSLAALIRDDVVLREINRWRQRAFEQAECLRCVYFIAWDREACGCDGGARTFSGTAALAMSGRA